jgi:uncharacterized protein (TIGR00369 family)
VINGRFISQQRQVIMASNTPEFELARSVLEAQPFSAHVGARLARFEEGTATLELDVADHLRQQYGLLHGGVLAYAADNALTFAAGTVLGPSVITSGLTISYLRPVRTGTVRATGTVVHHNGRVATCTVRLENVNENDVTLISVGQGAAMKTASEDSTGIRDVT